MEYCDAMGVSTAGLQKRMAGRSASWDLLLPEWDRLVDLLRHEIETSTNGTAPKTYAEMKRVLADGLACASCSSTGRGTECAKCKGTGYRTSGRCRAPKCYRGADTCSNCRGNGYTTTKTEKDT